MDDRSEDVTVDGLLNFIDASPTPYHAVANATAALERAGFVRLDESAAWAVQHGERVYVTRGGSSIAAFILGDQPPHEAGFLLVGAHTDSPNLRVKPAADVKSAGYRQLAVEPYGGLLWSTWLDRDLSLAGRVLVDDASAGGKGHLVDFRRPLLRIPNLAIHLNRTVNSDGLKLNAQSHLVPILGLDAGDTSAVGFAGLLAQQLAQQGHGCDPDRILAWDVCLYDVQPAAISGLAREFIHASRLDNLASCHAALQALCASTSSRPQTRGFVLYDHEEVGSESAQGAGSPFLGDLLARLARGLSTSHASADSDVLSRAIARSLLISADMAHAVHPNHIDKHEPGHRPVLGGGPVIKTNFAQSYATDAETSTRFQLLCRKAGVKPQHFVTRSDLACGSTIGPITAGRVGLRTVDVGSPLLSMHSIREMASSADAVAMQKVLDTFLE